jgi:hypothetical protein
LSTPQKPAQADQIAAENPALPLLQVFQKDGDFVGRQGLHKPAYVAHGDGAPLQA